MSEIDKSIRNFIEFHQQNFSLEAVIIWNGNYECVYTSKVVNKYLGIEKLENADTYDLEMLKELGSEFIPQVRNKFGATKKPYISNYLLKNIESNSYGIHQATVFPIINNDGEVIAVCSKIHQIRNDLLIGELIRQINHYNGYDFTIPPKISLESFSERELIIIFLLITGAKYKVIAEILSNIYDTQISEGSVKVMINRQIHSKFNTNINTELVVIAILNGFLYNVPAKLVHKLPKIISASTLIDFYTRHGLNITE